MPEAGARALGHLVRAAQELALALAAGASALGGHGPALLRVREVFAALADVLEPSARSTTRAEKGKFDPPEMRWDTRKRWRS